MKNILTEFLNLFFPKTCLACGDYLDKSEEYLCLNCVFNLPKTNYHNFPENEIEQRFWGKVPVERATAFLHFEKESSPQKLLHALKYHGEKELGKTFGIRFGNELLTSGFRDIDLIVPVPLHAKKLKKRGYNQSEWIAKGIAEKLKKPIDTENLIRTVENSTQTKKGLIERWENVSEIFRLKDKNIFENKHILLVDDVLTTGATIESCCKAILQSANTKISIAALAVA
jgi:ComF family protein